MSDVVYAPNRDYPDDLKQSIFLAGSIDMGNAYDWQQQVIDAFKDINGIRFFNPRRNDWDSSWEQSIDNPEFVEQVNWELDHIKFADIMVVVFDPLGAAPITLMELGHSVATRTKHGLFVCCPEGFWRKGNVDVLCKRHKIPVYNNLDDMIKALRDEVVF